MSSSCAVTGPLEQQGEFANALIGETLEKLAQFVETGATATIDLGGLPMSNRDREALDEFLGRGEVSAAIEVVGRTEIWETRFSAVWRVRHFGEIAIAADLIEIAACPKILSADRRDAESAALRMAEILQSNLRDRGDAA